MENKFRLILASQSPRRKELLQWTYLPFEIIPSDAPEVTTETQPDRVVCELAKIKATDIYSSVTEAYQRAFVIGSDTIVAIGDEILGKPTNREEAKLMLQKLAGKEHKVFTGVCFCYDDKVETFYDETKVYFEEIDDLLVELYLDTGEPMDKAGSYGIQGAALGFISRIEGSYSNVVGLPVHLVLNRIREIVGTSLNWRESFES